MFHTAISKNFNYRDIAGAYLGFNEKVTEKFIKEKVEELFEELGEYPKKKRETKSLRRKYDQTHMV